MGGPKEPNCPVLIEFEKIEKTNRPETCWLTRVVEKVLENTESALFTLCGLVFCLWTEKSKNQQGICRQSVGTNPWKRKHENLLSLNPVNVDTLKTFDNPVSDHLSPKISWMRLVENCAPKNCCFWWTDKTAKWGQSTEKCLAETGTLENKDLGTQNHSVRLR